MYHYNVEIFLGYLIIITHSLERVFLQRDSDTMDGYLYVKHAGVFPFL